MHRDDKLALLLRFDENAGFEHEGLKLAAAKIARELRRSRGSVPRHLRVHHAQAPRAIPL